LIDANHIIIETVIGGAWFSETFDWLI